MKLTATIYLRFFLLLLAIHCWFIYTGMGEWRLVSKLVLLPWLILTLRMHDKEKAVHTPKIVYAGLIFSFLGDLALTQEGEIMFLQGMLAFIATHICNSIFFIRIHRKSEGGMGVQVAAAMGLVILCAGIYNVLQDALGTMRIPILVYMAIISTMAVLATGVLRKQQLKTVALKGLIPGAFLFVSSDALLALNKFSLHQPMIDIAVMLTYGLAQYFLVKGFMLYTSVKPPQAGLAA